MKWIISTFALALLTVSCSKGNDRVEPLVKVGNSTLYRYELDKELPDGLSQADSLIAAENYIREWITATLVYDIARKNVGTGDDVNAMVEKYRKNLIIFKYEEKLIDEKFRVSPDDSAYYAKRKEFLKQTEAQIYERAQKRGEIQYFNKE